MTSSSAPAGSPRSVRPGRSSRRSTPSSSTAAGKHLFPAFVDPHVHLRTPGQEYKEDLETGTRAAGAGGFCQVVAMPNTDPVVDSPSILGALRETAARDARIPVGFMASITRGLGGHDLTEMEALREAGALGFTDDGKPVVSAGMLRRALQYQRLCGGVLALHEEDPTLSGGGAMHEGAVSALLGIEGIPSISESTIVARDAEIAGYEGGAVHMQHLSCVGLGARRSRSPRTSGTASAARRARTTCASPTRRSARSTRA